MFKKYKKTFLILVGLLSISLLCWAAYAANPVLPGLYADPDGAEFGGTYYIYPTTDGYPGWSGTSFKCFSSTDLVNWTDRGIILDLGPGVSWSDSQAWAPCIAYKSGIYYFYFCASAQIGVATSTSPTGPFTDALGAPLLTTNQYGCQSIDPDVFIDDDGQAYMYFGQGKCMVGKLNSDMKSFNGTPQNITPSGYNEGSVVFKRNGKYYLLWSENDTRSEDYRICYGTSSAPMGPFTKAANNPILVKNLSLGVKGTGHNSVIKKAGLDEWYIVYHRFAVPNGDGLHRETCMDRMYFNTDGTIQPVTVTLGNSPANIAYGKTASADSAQSANPASNGRDGSDSTRWCANDGNLNHWWKVDLGTSYNLTGTSVMWELTGKVYKYKIETSTDNTNWTLRVDKTANISTAQNQSDNFTASARYVRITVTGLESGVWASFFEFRVFNTTPVPTPTPPAISRIQSYNISTRFWRHYNFDVRIDPNVSPIGDSQWKIVPGLANPSGYISFESVNYPGYYLRQSNYDFSLAQNDGTTTFKNDATYKMVPGLKDGYWTSFQWISDSTRYIRHRDYILYLETVSTDTAKQDATWRITQ